MRFHRVLSPLLALTLFSSLPGFGSDLAFIHAKIYSSSTETAIEDGTILVHAGQIVAVGIAAKTKVPASAAVIDCKGCGSLGEDGFGSAIRA